jgi:hypothetical protein
LRRFTGAFDLLAEMIFAATNAISASVASWHRIEHIEALQTLRSQRLYRCISDSLREYFGLLGFMKTRRLRRVHVGGSFAFSIS